MKLIQTILQWLASILLVGQLFLWLMAIGSGHKIPQKTTDVFLRNIIILVVVLMGLLLWKRRKKS
jgi:hypothetical protein